MFDMKNEAVPVCIAIDGPSGAGKSTIAKRLAADFGFDYIDTGAMYRAVGYKMKQNGIEIGDPALERMLETTVIDFKGQDVLLDGEPLGSRIRTEEISKMASACSKIPAVREKLVALQREMGKRKSVVMDGRDIGSNVFPDAPYKFFLTATPEERAKRRFTELAERGEMVDFATVLADIEKRDYDDSHRDLNPLVKTDDAIEIDSTDMGIDDVCSFIRGTLRPE